MDNSNIWLGINILFWLITFIWYRIKYSYIGAAGLLLGMFLSFSVLSMLLYDDPFWGTKYRDLSLFPFMYLYIMIMISISPILKWDRLDVQSIGPDKSKILIIISWFFIISTLARVSSFSNLGQGLLIMVVDSSAGQDVYIEKMQESQDSLGDGLISNIFAFFSNMLFDFCVLFLFYFLSKRRKNWLTIVGLTLSCFICTILPIANSQRGPVLERILVITITYMAFGKTLSEKIKRGVNKVFVAIIALMSVPLVYITISRFDNRGVLGSLYSYFGQQNLFFNMYAFDNNGIRYGDRIFPVFKKILLFDNVPSNFWERRLKYPKLYINDEVFVGYVGDLLLDFGPIIPILIFIAYSSFISWKLRVRNGHICLYQMLPLMMLMHICVYGSLFLFPLADGGNYVIIAYMLMYFLLKKNKI